MLTAARQTRNHSERIADHYYIVRADSRPCYIVYPLTETACDFLAETARPDALFINDALVVMAHEIVNFVTFLQQSFLLTEGGN